MNYRTSLLCLCALLGLWGCSSSPAGEGPGDNDLTHDPANEEQADAGSAGNDGVNPSSPEDPANGADPSGTTTTGDGSASGGAAGPDGAPTDTPVSPKDPSRIVPVSGNLSTLVGLDPSLRLTYAADGRGNVLPDFSSVGYEASTRPIPSVAAVVKVVPGAGDDSARIQKAIDDVGKRALDATGFRGAVELGAGTYEIGTTLVISQSGIVLRGAGQDTNGTVLIATGTTQRNAIEVRGTGKLTEISGSRRKVVDAYVPVGAMSLRVASVDGLSVGDRIGIFRPSTANWIHDLGMDQIPDPDGDVVQWAAGQYDLTYERTITKIEGDEIFFDAPIVMALDEKYGGGAVFRARFDGRIDHVGIESLRMDSTYQIGKEDEDEAHAWVAISIDTAEHVWVQNLTALHFGYSAVLIERGARFVTVQDSQMLDPVSLITGGRRYSFNLNGSRVLFQRLKTRNGRHDFVTGSRVLGPNVFLDCVAEKTHADIGPHHRWATGTLFDNITGGDMAAQDRAHLGSGHGWAGANQVFWNPVSTALVCQKPETAQNYCIGLVGKRSQGAFTRPQGYWESEQKHVSPRSLFLAQLEDRAGSAAVKAVAQKTQYDAP